jgi:hypothetical protein
VVVQKLELLPVLGKAHDEVNFGTMPLIYSLGDVMFNCSTSISNDWNFVHLLYFVREQRGGEG